MEYYCIIIVPHPQKCNSKLPVCDFCIFQKFTCMVEIFVIIQLQLFFTTLPTISLVWHPEKRCLEESSLCFVLVEFLLFFYLLQPFSKKIELVPVVVHMDNYLIIKIHLIKFIFACLDLWIQMISYKVTRINVLFKIEFFLQCSLPFHLYSMVSISVSSSPLVSLSTPSLYPRLSLSHMCVHLFFLAHCSLSL